MRMKAFFVCLISLSRRNGLYGTGGGLSVLFHKFLRKHAMVFFAFLVTGCASTGDVPSTKIPSSGPGIYHKVKRGQTLWRIAQSYGVSLQEIVDSNHIPNVAKIEENQLVFIPGVLSPKEFVLNREENQNDFIWPLNGKVIRYFKDRKNGMVSNGIDIQSQEGETVHASRSGVVVFADYLTGHGYTVVLDHRDTFYSVYARNGKLLVKLDDWVSQNQAISQVGKMDDDLACLHFQIRKKSKEDNPLYYLP